jgi:hypothetical protein
MSDAPEAQQEDEPITREMIAQRAYELSQQDGAGSPEENWERAEQELLDKPGA